MTDYSTLTQDELNKSFVKASSKGELNIVAYLLTSSDLELHADVHANEDLALQLACRDGHMEVVQYLLSSPELKEHANIHAKKDWGLIWACKEGHLDIVQYLLKSPEITRHADIHADNDLALKWAFENGHMDVVNFLLYDMSFQVSDSLYEELFASDVLEFRHVVARRDLFFKMNCFLGDDFGATPKPKI